MTKLMKPIAEWRAEALGLRPTPSLIEAECWANHGKAFKMADAGASPINLQRQGVVQIIGGSRRSDPTTIRTQTDRLTGPTNLK